MQDTSTRQWVRATASIPEGGTVHMTILGYDGCTPPRNNYWSQVQGTIGGTVNLSIVNNKGVATPPRNVSVINGWAGCTVGHTFAIPALHLFIPVASPNALDSANNLCSVSPCTSGPHAVETFSFEAPLHGGIFRWQCFVPCGGGFIDGNGGPMQTIGYMDRQHGGKSLMATPEAPAAAVARTEPRHGMRIFAALGCPWR